MSNEKCLLCNISDFNIDEDYKMCYNCFHYYKEHNPNVIEDFERGLITKVEKKSNPCMNCDSNNITLIDEQYICLSCGCSNGYKFIDNKVEYVYYKKLFYNRKYQLEKYIKNMRIMKTLIE